MPPHGHRIGIFCPDLDKIFYPAGNTVVFRSKESGDFGERELMRGAFGVY
jgi:hypothetical protein